MPLAPPLWTSDEAHPDEGYRFRDFSPAQVYQDFLDAMAMSLDMTPAELRASLAQDRPDLLELPQQRS